MLSTLLAQLSASTTGVNWLYEFTNNITALTTQNGDALSQVGITFLSFIATIKLISMVIQFQMHGMALSFHHRPLEIGDLMRFLLILVVCLLLETYWVNPIPGAGIGLNHFFSYIAQVIVVAIDQKSIDVLLKAISDAVLNTPQPPVFAIIDVLTYALLVIVMGLASAVLFFINCSSFVFYAVCALFGPIFIPLLMTDRFKHKFYGFIEVLISFAMIRAVASAFIFVWANFLIGFLQETFHGQYTLGVWDAHMNSVMAVFGAFLLNMAAIPKITQIIFGGSAASATASVARFLRP